MCRNKATGESAPDRRLTVKCDLMTEEQHRIAESQGWYLWQDMDCGSYTVRVRRIDALKLITDEEAIPLARQMGFDVDDDGIVQESAWVWLTSAEDEAMPDCGCRLIRDFLGSGDPAIRLCPLHCAAGELLSALEGILKVANVRIDDPRIEQFDAARAAIAKVKGHRHG